MGSLVKACIQEKPAGCDRDASIRFGWCNNPFITWSKEKSITEVLCVCEPLYKGTFITGNKKKVQSISSTPTTKLWFLCWVSEPIEKINKQQKKVISLTEFVLPTKNLSHFLCRNGQTKKILLTPMICECRSSFDMTFALEHNGYGHNGYGNRTLCTKWSLFTKPELIINAGLSLPGGSWIQPTMIYRITSRVQWTITTESWLQTAVIGTQSITTRWSHGPTVTGTVHGLNRQS